MKGKLETHYYRASGFSPYYFAHVITNVVRQPMAYMRKLEEILGDACTQTLCRPFPRYSNLHVFIEDIVDDLFFEEPQDGESYLICNFLNHAGIANEATDGGDLDAILEVRSENEHYGKHAAWAAGTPVRSDGQRQAASGTG